MNTVTKVAAVQASYVLLNCAACLDKAVRLVAQAAAQGARIVVLPEAFIPGAPIWIDSRPIWDGDEQWFRLLVEQAVVVPGPVTEALGAAAREAGVFLVIGVQEREAHGATIFNTTLYFGPDGALLGKHRKLMPTGAERTVWGMGDGSTLPVVDTPYGRLSGLTCWENTMPLARFYLYAQGVDIWAAPTLARGDGWVATMRHIAREGALLRDRRQPLRARRSDPRGPAAARPLVAGNTARGRRVGRGWQQRDRRPQRPDPGRPGQPSGNDPSGRGRSRPRACGTPLVRPSRPLPPTRHLPAQCGHHRANAVLAGIHTNLANVHSTA